MSHRHPLHQPVRAMCNCCGITYEFEFTAKSEHVLCAMCRKHQRRTPGVVEQKNLEHIKAWQSLMQSVAERHGAAIRVERKVNDALRDTIASRDDSIIELRSDVKALSVEMERVLAEALQGLVKEPNERVIGLLARTVAEQANIDKDAAYRMRNSAMGRLWVVDEIHHEDDENNGFCSCGMDLTKCNVYGALTPIRNALYKWEIAQVERFEKDLSHGLPQEHYKVQERQRTYRQIS